MMDVHWFLIFMPLAMYFYILGLWHSARTPILMTGARDWAWLCWGCGGLVVFGPIGLGLWGPTLHRLEPLASLGLVLGYATIVMLLAPWFRNSAVIYNIDPTVGQTLLQEVGTQLGLSFQPHYQGFEGPAPGCHLQWEIHPRMRTISIRWLGPWPTSARDQWIQILKTQLLTLDPCHPRPHPALLRTPWAHHSLAWIWFASSCVLMALPLVGMLLTQPRAQRALWMLLERFYSP